MGVGVRGVGVRDFGELRGLERDEALMIVARTARWCVAELGRMVGAVIDNGSFEDDGHANPRAWLQAVMNCSRQDAGALVSTARMLRDLPEVAGELYDGALGESQLREIKRLYSNVKCRAPLIDGGQDVLAFWASRMPFDDFTQLTARAKAVADPDGRNRDHDRAHAERNVSTAIVGADFFLHARNGTAAGAEMITILDQFVEEEFQADLAELKQRCGENAPMIMLRRTAGQRRADALSRIFKTAAAATGTVDLGGAVVNFVTDPHTFATAVTDLFGLTPGIDPGVAADLSGQELFARARTYRSETTDGIPVDPRVIAAAALNGRMRRVIIDAAGVPVDVGRTRRFFTGPLREVLMMLWQRCFWPGCDLPAGRCEIDHLTGFTKPGGETRAGNGRPGCDRHNRLKEHGFTIWCDNTGYIHVYRPDGTEIAPLQRPTSDPTEDWLAEPDL